MGRIRGRGRLGHRDRCGRGRRNRKLWADVELRVEVIAPAATSCTVIDALAFGHGTLIIVF